MENKMRTISGSPEFGRDRGHENISVVEAFIASRINELQKYGWSNEAIAEALGVHEEFVENLREFPGSRS
jgi:hypothetical protein